MTTTETLVYFSTLIPKNIAAHVAVCEFSSEDSTTTLHIDLWRGFDLSDLHPCVATLNCVDEGTWDGGRSYSLQLN